MATLSAGSSVTVTVDIGQTLYIKGNAEVSERSGSSQVTGGEGRFGPYAVQTSVTIRAIGAIDYFENYTSESFEPEMLLSNDGTKVIGIKNPKGNDIVFDDRTVDKLVVNNPVTKLLKNVNGILYSSGSMVNSIGINAWDLFYDALKGGVAYKTDLATIASKGIKFLRVSATPNVAADITSYIGADGFNPVSTYIPLLNSFLKEANRVGVGIILVVCWNESTLRTALGGAPASDLGVSTSATRVWLRNFSARLAKSFTNTDGLAGWAISNEFVNYAWGEKFLTASSDSTKNHIGAMVEVTNDIVSAIRAYDSERIIMSAGGTLGSGSMGSFKEFAQKYVSSAGNCDAVSYHWYEGSYTSPGGDHAWIGTDLGGSLKVINALRAACAKVNKVLILDECCANEDNPPTSRAPQYYDLFNQSGAQLLLDWGWYSAASGGDLTTDLKTTRSACLDLIKARNAQYVSVGYSTDIPASRYPFPLGKTFGRTAAVANGWFRFANSPEWQPQAGKMFAILFKFREPAQSEMVNGRRLFACNDANGGFILFAADFDSSGIADYLQFQILVGGTAKGAFGVKTKRVPGEWNSYCFAWDGVVTGNSLFPAWMNGLPEGCGTIANVGSPAISTRDLYVGCPSDGASAFNAIDYADLVIVNRAGPLITTAEVLAWHETGKLPVGTVLADSANSNTNAEVGVAGKTKGSLAVYSADI